MDRRTAYLDRSINQISRFFLNKPKIVGVSFIVLIAILISTLSNKSTHYKTVDLTLPPNVLEAQNSPITNTAQPSLSTPLSGVWHTVVVKPGENMEHIFRKFRISPKELQAIMLLSEAAVPLTHLHPGQTLKLLLGTNHQLQQLILGSNSSNPLTITRTASGYTTEQPTTRAATVNNQAQQPVITNTETALNPVVTPATQPTQTVTPSATDNSWHIQTIQKGETIGALFQQLGLSAADSVLVAKADRHHWLRKMKPGQTIGVKINNGQLDSLAYNINAHESVLITRQGKRFSLHLSNTKYHFPTATTIPSQHLVNQPVVVKPTPLVTPASVIAFTPSAKTSPAVPTPYGILSGTITHSVYRDARRMGLTTKQTAQLEHLFNQEPEVTRSIHPGDHLSVVYQKARTGTAHLGDLLAVELSTHAKTYRFVRYTDAKGHSEFYTSNGMSLVPPIERAPVAYHRISSYFSVSRWQPLLHFFRPHYGVDYAAPAGSPIHAAGEGRIIFKGWERGFGNTIQIKHDRMYTTLYAHISRFASNIHDGSYVHKGQVIAYVGSTGLATGPHLHFEIHVNNVPHNPLTVALPSGAPISWASRKSFLRETRPLLTVLNEHPQASLMANKKAKFHHG